MKVLIIRFSSIGDIILTTPVVRCLKLQQPATEIHYLTKATYRPLLQANPYIHRIHCFDEYMDTLIDTLKRAHFDYVIDLHHNLRTLQVKRALNTPAAAFRKLNIQKWILVNFKVDLLPDRSIVDRYMDTVKPLGIKNDGQGLDYFIPEEVHITSSDIPMSHWAGYVGCVIGGSYATKQLPAAQWRQLATLIPYPMMLLGGPDDRELGDQIAKDNTVKIYNACGKFSLNESAWLVKKAKVVVSNDTGLMHVAAAFKKPLISLWGNTTPEMGMFPYFGYNNLKSIVAKDTHILENKNLNCRPCSKLGYTSCPRRHFNCMNKLDMNELAFFIEKYWC